MTHVAARKESEISNSSRQEAREDPKGRRNSGLRKLCGLTEGILSPRRSPRSYFAALAHTNSNTYACIEDIPRFLSLSLVFTIVMTGEEKIFRNASFVRICLSSGRDIVMYEMTYRIAHSTLCAKTFFNSFVRLLVKLMFSSQSRFNRGLIMSRFNDEKTLR